MHRKSLYLRMSEEKRNPRMLPAVLLVLFSLLLLLTPRAGRAAAAPTEYEAYTRMMALQDQYPEGMPWSNENKYTWKGGIFNSGYGCAGFAFLLSDAAFGSLPARRYYDVRFDELRIGDILRIKNNTHSVVVLEHYSDYLVVAEGNFGPADNKIIHWGRAFTREEVEETGTYYMTRYPEGPVHPDSGKYSTGVTWRYAEGTLTVNGTGPIPWLRSYLQGDALDPPWAHRRTEITNIRLGEGITAIEYGVFRDLTQLRTVIFDAPVEEIGENAFWGCDGLRTVVCFGRWEGTRVRPGNPALADVPKYDCIRGVLRLPDSVTQIEAEAFVGVENAVIRLPDNLIEADPSAFSDSVILSCRAGTSAEACCQELNENHHLDYFTE